MLQEPGTGHLNRTTQLSYDISDHVLSSTDPLGQTSQFNYNTLGQPVTTICPARGTAPAETVSYAYGANGRTETVSDNPGTTTSAYEANRDAVTGVTDPVTGATSYTNGPFGERTTMTLPGGGTWHYEYTLRPARYDRSKYGPVLTQVTYDQGRLVEYQADLKGGVDKVKIQRSLQREWRTGELLPGELWL